MDGLADPITAGIAPRATPQHPWRTSYQRSSNRSWWTCYRRTHQPWSHLTRPFPVRTPWARRSSSHGPGDGCSVGLSHLRKVVPSRPHWSALYLCPPGHLHWDRLFLIDWNSALSSAFMQGSHQGIWGRLIWPGSSLSAGLSHRHLSGPLRQGRRTQHLVRLIHPHGRETAPRTAPPSHRARPAPTVAALEWVAPVTAIKLSNKLGRRMSLVSGRYNIGTREFHRAESENSQRDPDPGKLHRHLTQQNHRAWRSEISQTNWPHLGAVQRPTSQMIPPFRSNHQSGVLPSSSRCRHPDGAASNGLSIWPPWHIGHHKSSKLWLG